MRGYTTTGTWLRQLSLCLLLGTEFAAGDVQIVRTDFFHPSEWSHVDTLRGWTRYAPDGNLGMVYRLIEPVAGDSSYVNRVIYRTIRPDGNTSSETVVSATFSFAEGLSNRLILLYDSQLRPHVLHYRPEYVGGQSRKKIDHYRKLSGLWVKEWIMFSTTTTSIDYAAAIGPDDSIHILGREQKLDGSNVQLTFFHMTDAGGTWTTVIFDAFSWPMQPLWWNGDPGNLSIVVDSQGHVHAAYAVVYKGNPANYADIELRHATNLSGAWTTEIVLGPANYDASAGNFGCISADSSGTVAVASTFQSYAPTGSLMSEQLFYHWPVGGGNWTAAAFVTAGDGYCGSDGCGFTGRWPHLLFDQAREAHAIFTDTACFHTPYQNCYVGQIRYAHHDGTNWNLATLFRQPVPTNSDNNAQLRSPSLAISPGGGQVHACGVERVAVAGQVTYRIVHVHALNRDGDDAYNTLLICGWTAPGTLLTFAAPSGEIRARVLANEGGLYGFGLLPQNWSGTVTPRRAGTIFQPPSRTYVNLTGNMPDQDFLPVSAARAWRNYR